MTTVATPGPSSEDDGKNSERRRLTGNALRKLMAEQMGLNATTFRRDFLRGLADPRRDLNDACGYPGEFVSVELYQQLYEREGVAARIVEIWPEECWQVTPDVYEDEDPAVTTPFEQAWKDLPRNLNSEPDYYRDDVGNPIWEYAARIDKLSGIGHYGVWLLGIDDGLPLDQPAMGVVEEGSVPKLVEKKEDDGDEPKSKVPDPSVNWEPYRLVRNESLNPRPKTDKQGNPVKDQNGTVQVETARKLVYMRVFPESQAEIVTCESNPKSPRYGLPTEYRITEVTKEDNLLGGETPKFQTRNVHWTRVIHVVDNAGSSEVWGIPRMRAVLNRVLDCRKLYGGSAEMYWRGAFPGLSFESTSVPGEEADYDPQALKDMYEDYANDLQRALFLMGMTVKSLAPTVVTPNDQLEALLDCICIALDVPKRIFVGSERGELSSDQDSKKHNKKIKKRHNRHLTPKVIRPLVNRLIFLGCLPEPPQGFCVSWPDMEAMSPEERATSAKMMADAFSAFVNGSGEKIIPAIVFLTEVCGFEEAEAQQWIMKAKEDFKVTQEEEFQNEKRKIKEGLVADPTKPTLPGIDPTKVGRSPQGKKTRPL